MQAAYREPYAEAVLHEDLEPVAAPIDEQTRVMRMRSTKHRHDPSEHRVHAGAQIHRLDRKPDGINADHFNHSLSKVTHSATADGQLIVIAVAPRRIATRMS